MSVFEWPLKTGFTVFHTLGALLSLVTAFFNLAPFLMSPSRAPLPEPDGGGETGDTGGELKAGGGGAKPGGGGARGGGVGGSTFE